MIHRHHCYYFLAFFLATLRCANATLRCAHTAILPTTSRTTSCLTPMAVLTPTAVPDQDFLVAAGYRLDAPTVPSCSCAPVQRTRVHAANGWLREKLPYLGDFLGVRTNRAPNVIPPPVLPFMKPSSARTSPMPPTAGCVRNCHTSVTSSELGPTGPQTSFHRRYSPSGARTRPMTE